MEFWVIIISIFFTEGSINPIIDNLSDFITKSFGIQSSQVGMIVPILFISLTPFSLILSKFIEHFPSHKRNMMIASRLLYTIALIILINIPQTDTPSFFNYAVIIIFLIIMSFNWAVFHSILEPGLACFVKEH
jgi:fucose permease